MMAFLMFVAGMVLLVWGADRFVMGASGAARRLGVPPLMIGLTIVAFGTSAPELAVSVTAALQGANEIAVGNVLGSNIFNLLGVAGLSALFGTLTVSRTLLRRDWPMSTAAAVLLAVLLLTGGGLSRGEGVLLLVCFAALLAMQVASARKEKPAEPEGDAAASWGRILIGIALGLAAIIWGGDLSVKGATGIARLVGLSENVIALTVVAIGTSLPELVTSVAATRHGEHDIAMGNVIGSNLFNILFILGVSTVLHPISVQPVTVLDALFLTAISVIFWFAARRGKLGRLAGGCMALCYVGYTAWLLLR